MKQKTFDIFRCTDKSKLFPALAGVYYDDTAEMAVASDNHMLVASRSDYKPEFAGTIRTKNGFQIMKSFPKWKSVISEKRTIEFEINRSAVRKVLEAADKTRSASEFQSYFAFLLNGAEDSICVKTKNFLTMLDFMDVYNIDKIQTTFYPLSKLFGALCCFDESEEHMFFLIPCCPGADGTIVNIELAFEKSIEDEEMKSMKRRVLKELQRTLHENLQLMQEIESAPTEYACAEKSYNKLVAANKRIEKATAAWGKVSDSDTYIVSERKIAD